MRLTKGLYGHEFEHKDGLFSLFCGQMRGTSVSHNGGWYNQLGEKLGWGDLSQKDLEKISKGLKPGEAFIVLGEHESFWNFVTRFGPIGAMCEKTLEESAPGIDYVADHARFAIFPGEIHRLGQFEPGEMKREDLKTRWKEMEKS